MVSETIVLVGDAEDELVRERLAFSNGLARSAKLAVLESQLEMYLERNRHLPLLMMVRERCVEGKRLEALTVTLWKTGAARDRRASPARSCR